MARMARSIGLSLAVPLLGRTWINPLVPNTRLTLATHTGNEVPSRTAAPPPEAGSKGNCHGHNPPPHRSRDLFLRSRSRRHPHRELGDPAGRAGFFADPPGPAPGQPGNPPRDWPLRPPAD